VAKTPEFIEHYINQLISEECIIELNKLSGEYHQERKKIDVPERHVGDRTYVALKGKENPNSVANELKRLEQSTKQKALEISKREAEKYGSKLIEFPDPENEKQKDKKQEASPDKDDLDPPSNKKKEVEKEPSNSSDKDLSPNEEAGKDQKQEQLDKLLKPWRSNEQEITSNELKNIAAKDKDEPTGKEQQKNELLNQLRNQWRANELELTQDKKQINQEKENTESNASSGKTKEEQKQQLVESMKKQWGMDKQVELNKTEEQKQPNAQLTKEEKHAQLVEQMRARSIELEKNKEREREI
jgi:hypothetical protein